MTRQKKTVDHFLNEKIRVCQDADGYRFSVDAVILAWHVFPSSGAKIIDLGTGCGIIPLILAYRYPSVSITGIELQPRLAELASENVKANGFEDRIKIINADIKDTHRHLPRGKADIVVCNPPFIKADSGRINPHPERAVARHELAITLGDIVAQAKRLLSVHGEFTAIYPAFRLPDLITAMRESSIEPKLMRTVHSRNKEGATLVVLKGVRNGRAGLTIEKPLVLYKENGEYTAEANKMFMP